MSADGLVRFGLIMLDGDHLAFNTKVSPSTDDFQFCNNIYVNGNYMSFDIGKSRIEGGWSDGQGHPAMGFVTLKDNHGGIINAAVSAVYAKARSTTTAFIITLSNPRYTDSNQLIG